MIKHFKKRSFSILLAPLLLIHAFTWAVTCYVDADFDGFGAAGTGFTPADGDCLDHGESAVDTDCDDTDRNEFPGGPEFCDGVDNNCNVFIDEGVVSMNFYQDLDGDGFGDPTVFINSCNPPAGYIVVAGDCDDTLFSVNPWMTEICGDGLDNDCNPATADLCSPTPSPTATASATPSQTSTPTVSSTTTLTGSPTATATVTPSVTITATPSASSSATSVPTAIGLVSNLNKTVLAPVPATGSEEVCLYFKQSAAASHWKIFNVAGEKVSQIKFNQANRHCWQTMDSAAGIYLVRIEVLYTNGMTETLIRKIALIK